MTTFRCTRCGFQLQRPSQPYQCPQCGAQAVGLFQIVQPGTPAPPSVPQGVPPAAPTQPVTPTVPTGAVPVKPNMPMGQPPMPPQPVPQQPAVPTPQPPAQQPPVPPAPTQQQAFQPNVPPPPPQQPAPPVPQPPAQSTPQPPQPTPEPPNAEPPLPPGFPKTPSEPQPAPTPRPKQPRRPAPRQPSAPVEKDVSQPRPTRKTKRPAPAEPPRPSESKSRRASASSTRSRTKPTSAETRKSEPALKPKPKTRPEPVRPEQFAWAYPKFPPETQKVTPLRNAPAVDSTGRIYLHAQGKLVGLDVVDDSPKPAWEYVTGSHAPGPVVIAADGTLRLHTSDGMLHCVSPEGKQVYSPVTVGEPLGYAAAIVDSQRNTYISRFEGGLIRIDVQGRRQKPGPYFRSRQKLDCPGVIQDGVLYIGSEDGFLFAIRLDENKGRNLMNHAAQKGTTGWYINSWPAVTADGLIVLACRDEHLYGFDAAGDCRWKTQMPGQVLGSPVIDRHGQIYIGTSQSRRGQEPGGTLVCLDGNSHKIRWEYRAAGPVESTPVIGDDDVIYIGDNSGTIHAVDFQGQAKWTAKVHAPVRSAGTILARGRVAFGLDDETLIVLKCDSDSLATDGWPKIGGH